MINESKDYYNHSADSQTANGPQGSSRVDREFQGLISSAIERAVSQYHSLLRQGLDLEVKRIVGEFESATNEIDVVIARRVRARMMEMVQDEVRRVFDDTLTNAEDTLDDPIWERARDNHLSFITDFSREKGRDHENGDYENHSGSTVDSTIFER